MAIQNPALQELQNEWKEMYQKSLPAAARSKSTSQPKWPVHNDHCFARIILDFTVGITAPWTSKVKSPAYKNMSKEQLQISVALGEQILIGEVDLVELDERSLELRGKAGKKDGKVHTPLSAKSRHLGGEILRKRERAQNEGEAQLLQAVKRQKLEHDTEEPSDRKTSEPASNIISNEDPTPWLKKIALCQKTTFQKKVLSLLCQVPRGQYTTYGAISKHMASSPRAVGNAIRNNPFAPHVPCHRILATGGGIGGFHGSWGRNGEAGLNDDKKRNLLRDEGVRFDGKGKVVGLPWVGFE